MTYFPISFRLKDLVKAYREINSATGWSAEERNGATSYVGEHDRWDYKIRIALHHNDDSPDLITAYPVSSVDRQTHKDFARVKITVVVEKPSTSVSANDRLLARTRTTRAGLEGAVRPPTMTENPLKRLLNYANTQFIDKAKATRIVCPAEDEPECLNQKPSACATNLLLSKMKSPEILEGVVRIENSWCYDSIELGTPWYFVVDEGSSLTLVLQCCSDYMRFIESYPIDWDAQAAATLRALVTDARGYKERMESKALELAEIKKSIKEEDKRQRKRTENWGSTAEETVEVIDIGCNGCYTKEDFVALHPSQRIGRRLFLSSDSISFVYYMGPDDELQRKLRRLASEIQEYNQWETDQEKAEYCYLVHSESCRDW